MMRAAFSVDDNITRHGVFGSRRSLPGADVVRLNVEKTFVVSMFQQLSRSNVE